MKTPFRHLTALLIGLMVAGPITPSAFAYELGLLKLSPKNASPMLPGYFGQSVAISEKWILIGEPRNHDKAIDAGCVHVMSPTTGLELRKLFATDAAAGDYFGWSCAVVGDLAVVGAVGKVGYTGAAYVFNLATGAQIRRIIPSNSLIAGDNFGYAVAATGNSAVITAPNRTGNASQSGMAFVFDLTTGVELITLLTTNGATNDLIGRSVAACGSLVVLGSQFVNHPAANAGAAYVFDLVTGQQLFNLSPTGNAAGQLLGSAVAIQGTRICVGAPGDQGSGGSAYLYDTSTGLLLSKLTASDGQAGNYFGFAVGFGSSVLMIGAPGFASQIGSGACYAFAPASGDELKRLVTNDISGPFGTTLAISGSVAVFGVPGDMSNAGTAYLTRDIAGPLPVATMGARGSFAPGAPDTVYTSFGETVMNGQDETLFSGLLTGTGSAGGKNIGLWSTAAGPTLPVARLGPLNANTKFAVLSQPRMNDPSTGIFRVKYSGTGINQTNSEAIYQTNGSVSSQFFSLASNGWIKMNDIVQGFNFFAPRVTVAGQIQLGYNGTTLASDTAIKSVDMAQGFTTVREGDASASIGGQHFGQFTGRVAFTNNAYAWSCAMQDSPVANNAAVFKVLAADANHVDTAIAIKGGPVPGVANGLFSAFLGESISLQNSVLIHAKISGSGVTNANNEGLWSTRSGTLGTIVRKGNLTGLAPKVVFSAFPKFWAVGSAPDQAIFLAKLSGPGVTAANDMSLWLAQEDGTMLLLMREGNYAPGGQDRAKIGVISSVEVEPFNGRYAVLTTLVGGQPGEELALWSGTSSAGDAVWFRSLRLPQLRLRKGTRYNAPLGGVSQLKSIALPALSTDATGAGCKGLGQSINNQGGMVLRLTFNDGASILANGTP